MAQSRSEGKLQGVKDVFEGLSFSQVTAGALAAATSMLLASNVGIAGTVIGVAVSSVVSAVASQVYKKFLVVSAEKVKDLAPVGLNGKPREEEAEGAGGTEVLETVQRPETTRVYTDLFVEKDSDETLGDAYADAAILRSRAARERKRKIQRNTLIVAVVSAVIAVVICALTIDVATQGKGLGPQMPTATYMQSRNSAAPKQEDALQEEEELSQEKTESSDAQKEQEDAVQEIPKDQDSSSGEQGGTSSTPGSSGEDNSDQSTGELGSTNQQPTPDSGGQDVGLSGGASSGSSTEENTGSSSLSSSTTENTPSAEGSSSKSRG